MKSLMIGWTPPKEGGSEQHIFELSSRTSSSVLTQRGSICRDKIELAVPIKPVWLANFSFFIEAFLYSVYLLFSRKKYEVIHIHENILYFLVPILRLRYKVVVTIHGINGFKFYDNKILWQIFKTPLLTASAIIAVNKADQSKLSRYFRNVFYIPNGVDVNLYAKTKSKVENKISFVGRIHEQKGVIYLLEAFSILSKKNPSLKLELIGDVNQYAQSLMKLFPNKNILWRGYMGDRKQLAKTLKSARVIVLPSLWEGLPLTLFEALGTARPVVLSDIPAFRSIITSKEAIFAKAKNARDLADKVSQAIEDKAKSEIIGKNGQKKARLYDWSEIASSLEKVYFSLK